MDNKFRKRNSGDRASNLSFSEEDVINYMNEHFKELTPNPNRRSAAGLRNSKLVTNIIDKFSKIFDLWDENRLFQRSIERSVFEKIYKNLKNVFGADHNRIGSTEELSFILTCKECGVTFPLRNQDCIYSFECHKNSKKHKEFLKSLKTDGDAAVPVRDNTVALKTDLQMEINATVKDPGYEQLFLYARCYLCSEHITRYDPAKSMDDDTVGNCLLTHIKTIAHRKNSKLFLDNKQNIESVCAEKLVFRCKLCKIELFLDEMVPHFYSVEHKAVMIESFIDKYLENIMLID